MSKRVSLLMSRDRVKQGKRPHPHVISLQIPAVNNFSFEYGKDIACFDDVDAQIRRTKWMRSTSVALAAKV